MTLSNDNINLNQYVANFIGFKIIKFNYNYSNEINLKLTVNFLKNWEIIIRIPYFCYIIHPKLTKAICRTLKC